MSLFMRAAFAAVVVGAFAAFAPAAHAVAPVPPEAGKAVTFPFHAKAPIVVQLTGIGAARERLAAMLKAALPDEFATINKQVDEGLKQLLAERKLTAIPKDGRVYLVVNDIPGLFEDQPDLAVLIPVTSYKEFRATFLTEDERKSIAGEKGVDELKAGERSYFMVDLKDYVAVSPDKATAEKYAGKFTRAATAAMPPELAKSFLGSDLALYINFDVINDLYGEQIKGFKGIIDFGLQQAQGGGMLPGINKKQLEVAKSMIHGMFQAVEDSRGLVIGVEFRPEGLNVRLQMQFADDTASVGLLKAELPSGLKGIERLPAGMHQYTSWALGKKFMEALRGLSPEFAPADDDEKGNALIEQRLKAVAAAGLRSEFSATAPPDVTLTLSTYADPKKAVVALAKCYEAMNPGGRMTAVLKDKPKVTENARTHAAFTFTEVRLSYDFDATVKDLPEGIRENTLGQLKRAAAEKTTLWIGTDGKTVMQVTAKDWDTATAAIDRYLDTKEPIGESESYKTTRKQLPQDVSFLLMVETSQLLTGLAETLRAMEGTVPGFPRIGKVKPVKGDPTFIGFAVTFKGDAATLNLFIPNSAIAAGRKIVAGLFSTIE